MRLLPVVAELPAMSQSRCKSWGGRAAYPYCETFSRANQLSLNVYSEALARFE